MSNWVSCVAVRWHLAATQQRLGDATSPVAGMSFAQVVDAFWSSADGWRPLGVEPTFHYVASVMEHPEVGIGVTLMGTAPAAAPYVRGSVEAWDTLGAYDRGVNVRGAMHVQAPNRMALVAALVDRYVGDTSGTVATRALAHAVVSSAAVMDSTTRMMVALSGAALVAEAERFRADAAAREVRLPPLQVCSYA